MEKQERTASEAILAYVSVGEPIDSDLFLEFAHNPGHFLGEVGAAGLDLFDPELGRRYELLCQFATRKTVEDDYRGWSPYKIDPDSGNHQLQYWSTRRRGRRGKYSG